MKQNIQKNKVAIALDCYSLGEADGILDKFHPPPTWVKVGTQLFLNNPDSVLHLTDEGFRVMLDLKLHDIPTTVEKTVKAVSKYADLLTVHVSGGYAMLDAALQASQHAKILGVTCLTSLGTDELKHVGYDGYIDEIIYKQATTAAAAGVSGLVLPCYEIPLVRSIDDFMCVTPGIRFGESSEHKNAPTPEEAISFGSDLLVLGRAVTELEDPNSIF